MARLFYLKPGYLVKRASRKPFSWWIDPFEKYANEVNPRSIQLTSRGKRFLAQAAEERGKKFLEKVRANNPEEFKKVLVRQRHGYRPVGFTSEIVGAREVAPDVLEVNLRISPRFVTPDGQVKILKTLTHETKVVVPGKEEYIEEYGTREIVPEGWPVRIPPYYSLREKLKEQKGLKRYKRERYSDLREQMRQKTYGQEQQQEEEEQPQEENETY
jgi:hypothetical protein